MEITQPSATDVPTSVPEASARVVAVNVENTSVASRPVSAGDERQLQGIRIWQS